VCSKAQYETRLKKWGFRKYANKDQWNSIFQTLCIRESQGKESEVFFRGEVLDGEKIEKERRRYGAISDVNNILSGKWFVFNKDFNFPRLVSTIGKGYLKESHPLRGDTGTDFVSNDEAVSTSN
jgi:hypothetical protein